MKLEYYVTLILIFFAQEITAQQNLVPNPSFEDTLFCPFVLTQINAASGWSSFGNSSDYFNGCATNGINVPNNDFGFQYAHSGIAFAGLIPYRIPTSPDGPNYREFIGVQLTHPLSIGEKYFFSFYLNYSYYIPYQAMACDKLGMKFSTVSYSTINSPLLDNFAHLFTDSIQSDTITWVKISGSFIADSIYAYVIIGNFFDDQHTDTLSLSSFPDTPYYYIDDVCVSRDSLFNENWTKIEPIILKPINYCYINSLANEIRINENCKNISIINSIGENIYFRKLIIKDYVIDISFLSTGVYILQLELEKSLQSNILFVKY